MKKDNNFFDPNEKIIWQGRERFFPRFVFLILYKFLIAFGIFVVGGMIIVLGDNSDGLISLFLGLVFLMLCYMIYMIMLNGSIHYIITDKRVIGYIGIIRKKFKFIDFDKIQNIDIKISFSDRLAGGNTGSIIIMSASETLHFYHVANSFEVVKILKNTSYNIKTDINFPNALRPDTNPGYNTKYKS